MVPNDAISIPILEKLGFMARRSVRKEAEWFCLPGGQILFDAGDSPDRLYFCVSGALGAFRRKGERMELIGHIRPGEPAGEMALFADEPHTAAVYALRDTEILALPREAMLGILKRRPDIMGDLSRMMINRMRRRSPRSSAPRVFALIGTSPSIELKAYGRQLAEAIRRCGDRCIYLDGDQAGDLERLDEIEDSYDFVILAAPLKNDVWTHAVLRQSDRIWLIGRSDARPSDPLFPEEWSPLARLRLIDLILLHPYGAVDQASAAEWRDAADAARMFHWRIANTADLDALARTLVGKSVGLVMSGGGARAYAHIGAVRALREEGFSFDFLGGTSMGAIIAASVAMGWDDTEIDWRIRKAFVDTNPLADWVLPVVALTRGAEVDKRLVEHFGDTAIEELHRPFFCVSTNLTAGEPHVHRGGRLRDALRASIAIPGLLPPKILNDELHVDGAVMKNFAADEMRNFHRGSVIGLDVGRSNAIDVEDFRNPPGFFRWILRNGLSDPPPIASLLLRSATAGREGESLSRRELADLMITPKLEGVDIRNWKSYDRAVQEGYDTAKAALKDLGGGPETLEASRHALLEG